MIPSACKRLAEVDFPIAVVSKHAAREKSIRHGHPSTLHLWWARRPLASCRAMLLALLLPDPADPLCPGDFKAKARELLPELSGKIESDEMDLRRALLKFIGDFANWDNSAHPEYLRVGRGLVKAAHPEETPLVVDPFAGGGSIPLEALRLGCEAFASDLNPVACLILKVMLEDIPRHGPELAEELRRVGKEIKEKAEKELAEFYPKDADGATPIAYLWARTVRCESPNCGAEIPLLKSFWLCKKSKRKFALQHKVARNIEGDPRVEFEIFQPNSEVEVHDGTVSRANATCLCCGSVLPADRVRLQLSAQHGGADVVFADPISGPAQPKRIGGARLHAVVVYHAEEQGRHYRLPTEQDYQVVYKAQRNVNLIHDEWKRGDRLGLCPIPNETLPRERTKGNSGFRVLLYGMSTFGDLFAARQLWSLILIGKLIKALPDQHMREILSLSLDKLADFNSSIARWATSRETSAATFGRQALPMMWDYCETVPLGNSTGSLAGSIEYVLHVADQLAHLNVGSVLQADACALPVPDGSASIYFTDPPYYDSIAYADLSDFFYVWLKRALNGFPFQTDPSTMDVLTPKISEAIQDPARSFQGRPKDRTFYEEIVSRAFKEGRRALQDVGLGCIVFAHKTTEGWEALLTGQIKGGWQVVASWPIATERGARLVARDTAALGTSVHLICRPRPEDASVGDWSEVLRELPKRVGDWMERLQGEGVRGADLVFACIGPALEIFSRYSKVETAEGREVTLAEYLMKVWEVVGRSALEQVLGTAEAQARNGGAGALEEDARLTALFLWTLQATDGKNSDGDSDSEDDDESDDEDAAPKAKSKGYSLVYDVVRRFAQPLGIGLPKWEGRIIETAKGVVRLLPVSERARQLFGEEGVDTVADWLAVDPSKDLQMMLFPTQKEERVMTIRPRRSSKVMVNGAGVEHHSSKEATTLDRVHAAMLLQAGGQANALRALIKTEQQRGQDFLRLANALSALYPPKSEEKRLLDAMLLAAPK